MKLGTATSTPGMIETGWLDVTDLPTGSPERLPVVLVEGEARGPTLWVTAGLHGDEVTGIAAAQDVVTQELAERLRGTLVCIPVMNPAGLRRAARTSYYHNDDPNRYFPTGDEATHPPSVQELIDARIFERFTATADALVSLHSAWINERIFTIVERARYGETRSRADAEAIATRTHALAEAFGLPIVREYDVDVQDSYDLNRSFEAAAINRAGIPAITPELGSPQVVEEAPRAAAVTGIRNVLRHLDMLPGDVEPAGISAPVDYPVKRVVGPVTSVAGIVRHHVSAGDVVAPGDPIADIVTPHGEVRETVTADADGYVLGRREGIAVYENDPLVSFVERDEGSLVVEAP